MESNPTTPGVLVIGRSRAVLEGTVELLSERGYAARATDDFEAITDQVDPRALDIVLFGGQIPPAKKAEMRDRSSPRTTPSSSSRGSPAFPA